MIRAFGLLPASQEMVLSFDTIDSTNEEAKRLIVSGEAQDRMWLQASEQEKGRGRQGREWISGPGNLYTSHITHSPSDIKKAAQSSFVAAVSTAASLRQYLPDTADITAKWPNDILVDNRKIAGILLETMQGRDGQLWLIIGIGVNLAHKPEDTRWPATCLLEAGGVGLQPYDFLDAVAQRWRHWYEQWTALGFVPICDAWMRMAHGLGGYVRFGDGQEGIFLGLNEHGAARIRLDSGVETLIHAGEMFFAGAKGT